MKKFLTMAALSALLVTGAGHMADAQTVSSTPTVPPGIGGAAAGVGQANQAAPVDSQKKAETPAPVASDAVKTDAAGQKADAGAVPPKPVADGKGVVVPSMSEPGKFTPTAGKTTGKTGMIKSHKSLKTQQVKAAPAATPAN